MRDGNHDGKNKEQMNSPPYLHAILPFPNYLHVQYRIFHSTQYFPDSHYTLSSAPMTTDEVGHVIGIFRFLLAVGKKLSNMFMGFLWPQCHKLIFSKRHV